MRMEDRWIAGIRQAIRDSRLTLPTLPAVAMHISQVARRENVSAAALASEIAEDPALAMRLLRVANSAAYRALQPISDLQQGIARLGLTMTRHLVVGLALDQIFESPSATVARRLNLVHQRSLRVAATAQVLARRYSDVDPELAMLGGLVHEIGALPILRAAAEDAEAEGNSSALDGALAEFEGAIGRMILIAWDMPRELFEVPAGSHRVLRDHDGPADCTDVILVARLQLASEGAKASFRFDPTRIPAYRKLDLDPRIRLLEKRGFAQEVANAEAALSVH